MNIIDEMLVGNSGRPFWIVWAEDAEGTLALVATAYTEAEKDRLHRQAALVTPIEETHPPASRMRTYMEEAKRLAKYGPWSDQIAKVVPPADMQRIEAFWRMMPGYSSRMSAFYSLLNAGTGEGTRVTQKVCL